MVTQGNLTKHGLLNFIRVYLEGDIAFFICKLFKIWYNLIERSREGVLSLENIGNILKNRRLELGFTIAEMSEKTKISEDRLEAIEEGNLAFFSPELSYLKFYIRYYAQAMYLDFETLKADLDSDINDYEKTQSLKKIEVHTEMNKKIKARVKQQSNSLHSKGNRKRTDFAMIGFLVLALLIVLLMSYVFVNSIWPNLLNPSQDTPVVIPPADSGSGTGSGSDTDSDSGTGSDVDPAPAEALTVTFDQQSNVDSGTIRLVYRVSGYTAGEALPVTVIMNTDSYMRWTTWTGDEPATISTDGPVLYASGNNFTETITAEDNLSVYVRLGYLGRNTMTLGDVAIEFPEISVKSSSLEVILIFEGE